MLNVTTNNLANLKTAGYKSDTAIPTTFNEELLLLHNRRQSETGTIRYRTLEETFTHIDQGTFENTNSRLDMATSGSVFFNISRRTTGETLLTKNGQFNINAEGYLALGSSGLVLDENEQPIQIGTADFTVSRDGVITVGDGREFTLGLTYIPEDADVEKVGDNLIRPYEPEVQIGNIPADYRWSVMQGWYERSNVDLTRETVRAMEAQNIFNACASALKIINAMNGTATNELAKL